MTNQNRAVERSMLKPKPTRIDPNGGRNAPKLAVGAMTVPGSVAAEATAIAKFATQHPDESGDTAKVTRELPPEEHQSHVAGAESRELITVVAEI